MGMTDPLDSCLLEQRRRSWVMVGAGRPVSIPSEYAVALADELQQLRAKHAVVVEQLKRLLQDLAAPPG